MKLSDLFKKPQQAPEGHPSEMIYALLFCDQPELYKNKDNQPDVNPWSALFADQPDPVALQAIIRDDNAETRIKLLAYNRLQAAGYKPEEKVLLGVIVEIGFDQGLDVLASYRDGSARYINQSGKMIFWDATDETSEAMTQKIFAEGEKVVQQIGPWDKPRLPRPDKGLLRISFLVSDGLYFGQGPIDVMFNEPVARPVLGAAGELMQYLTERAGEKG
jgi:hypothetical protein